MTAGLQVELKIGIWQEVTYTEIIVKYAEI